jgi:hypothetical protein
MKLYDSSAAIETDRFQKGCGKTALARSGGLELRPASEPDEEPVWERVLVKSLRLLLGIYLLPVVLVIAGTTFALDLVWRCGRLRDVVFLEVAGKPGRELSMAKPAHVASRQRRNSTGSFYPNN